MSFLVAHLSSPLRSFQTAVWPCGVSTTLSSFVSSADFLGMHFVPSRSLITSFLYIQSFQLSDRQKIRTAKSFKNSCWSGSFSVQWLERRGRFPPASFLLEKSAICYQCRRLLRSLQILYVADTTVLLSNHCGAKWKFCQPQERDFLCISTKSFSTGVFIMMIYYENSWCSMALTLILPPHQSHVSVTPPYALNNLGIMLTMQNSRLNSNFIFITKYNFIITWKISLFLRCLENSNCFYHSTDTSEKFLWWELWKYSRLLSKRSASTVM